LINVDTGRLNGVIFGLLLVFTVPGCAPAENPLSEGNDTGNAEADTILFGGVVASMDSQVVGATAVAVLDHRIAAVGSDEEIQAWAGPATQLIDLDGRLLVPGLIEGHGHFMSFGRAQQIIDLNDVRNWQEAVGRVAVAVDAAEAGEWIFGRGWHQEKWDRLPADAVDGVPLNQTLSRISPNNPVLLGHASGHAAFANDAALAAAGIRDATPSPEGGTIVRDSAGRATGLLRETAQRLVAKAAADYQSQRPREEQHAELRGQVLLAGEQALAHGITSFHDAGASFATIDFLKEMEAADELPIRLYVMVRGESNEDLAANLSAYRMETEENDFLTVRSIKRQLDGALGAHGAWLLAPYTDLPETDGLVLESVDEIEETARLAIEHGYQLNTHAIGDRANREILDLYERAFTEGGADGKSLRWRIEHAQHVDPVDVPRFGQLGVIAAFQGIHSASDGPWISFRLGNERTARTSYPWRDLIESGALLANGTDVPVEPIDAMASLYATVSRRTSQGALFFPEQALSREEALASYTINNATAAFEEHVKGSITPGKWADLVVLSQDFFTVPEADIPDIEIDMTLVGGQVRYRRN
jgi:predicted amidohydrolase YtcJ